MRRGYKEDRGLIKLLHVWGSHKSFHERFNDRSDSFRKALQLERQKNHKHTYSYVLCLSQLISHCNYCLVFH